VNSFTRGLSIALCCVGLLGVTGCGADNETEGEKLANAAGDPGPPNPNSKPVTISPGSGTEDGRAKAMLENQKNMPGYPGTKK